jgi:hypothetical protein
VRRPFGVIQNVIDVGPRINDRFVKLNFQDLQRDREHFRELLVFRKIEEVHDWVPFRVIVQTTPLPGINKIETRKGCDCEKLIFKEQQKSLFN